MRVADRLMSASGDTTTGFLPPNSRVTGTRFRAAACCTSEPTDGEPVKNKWSSGRLENAAETSGPPVTMSSSVASKYLGAVAFISSAVRGVISEILIITRLPAANATRRRGRARARATDQCGCVAPRRWAGPLPGTRRADARGLRPRRQSPLRRCRQLAPEWCSFARPIGHCLADQNCLLSTLLSAIRCYADGPVRRKGLVE